jgi:hypothetical protein
MVPRTQEQNLNTFNQPNLHGKLKPMQRQEHTKCSNPFLPNRTKATKAMEQYEMKNNEVIHKELQDQDLIDSSHLKEILIGENVDLNPLSLFSQKDYGSIEGMESKDKLFKVNNGGEGMKRPTSK